MTSKSQLSKNLTINNVVYTPLTPFLCSYNIPFKNKNGIILFTLSITPSLFFLLIALLYYQYNVGIFSCQYQYIWIYLIIYNDVSQFIEGFNQFPISGYLGGFQCNFEYPCSDSFRCLSHVCGRTNSPRLCGVTGPSIQHALGASHGSLGSFPFLNIQIMTALNKDFFTGTILIY